MVTQRTRLKVLVADDNPTSLHFFAAGLAQLGADCCVASDGDQALRLAVAQRFDLLILDLRMPRLDGCTTLRRLRAEPGAASGRTTALASSAEPGAILSAALQADGFAALLPKPLSLADLANCLARFAPDGGRHAAAAEAASGKSHRHEPGDDLDDAAALTAVGHKPEILAALRSLLLRELLEQGPAIDAWIARDERQSAHDALHRLRASAGFCGARRLERAIAALSEALGDDASGDLKGLVHNFEQARTSLVAMLSRVDQG